jgi:hypothetical protein
MNHDSSSHRAAHTPALRRTDYSPEAKPTGGVRCKCPARPIGPHCDIGAYEAGYLFLPLILK